MHVIVKGAAKASVMQAVGVLGPGDAFGDQALMSGELCNDCLVANGGEVVTLWMNPNAFNDLDLKTDLLVSKTKARKKQMVT